MTALMPHPHWSSQQYAVDLPHNKGNVPQNLRGSASAPTLKKASSRIKVPRIVQQGGVGRYATEYIGNGKMRWAPVAPLVECPPEMHADNRPSKTRSIDVEAIAAAAADRAVRDLGYCRDLPRKEKPLSLLNDIVPAQWKAYGTPMVPDLPTEGLPRPVNLQNCMEDARAEAAAPKIPWERSQSRCAIKTWPEIRVLHLQPNGDRLVVKRWTKGFTLMKGHSAGNLRSSELKPLSYEDPGERSPGSPSRPAVQVPPPSPFSPSGSVTPVSPYMHFPPSFRDGV